MSNQAEAPATRIEVEELLLNRGIVIEEVDLNDLDLYDQTFAISNIEDDESQTLLSESLRRDGQLDPIIVRKHAEKWQIVDGFRRVRAAMSLGLDRLKARRFDQLSASEAVLWVLRTLTIEPPTVDRLDALAARLVKMGEGEAVDVLVRYREAAFQVEEEAPAEAAPSSIESEVAEVLGGETQEASESEAVEEQAQEEVEEEVEDDQPVEEEVTVDELAEMALGKLSDVSQDFALIQENWQDLAADARRQILEHLKYFADLAAYLK